MNMNWDAFFVVSRYVEFVGSDHNLDWCCVSNLCIFIYKIIYNVFITAVRYLYATQLHEMCRNIIILKMADARSLLFWPIENKNALIMHEGKSRDVHNANHNVV